MGDGTEAIVRPLGPMLDAIGNLTDVGDMALRAVLADAVALAVSECAPAHGQALWANYLKDTGRESVVS